MSKSAKIMHERGLPHPHDEDMEKNYTKYNLENCRKRKDEWKGGILMEYFKETFECFSLEMFKNLPKTLR